MPQPLNARRCAYCRVVGHMGRSAVILAALAFVLVLCIPAHGTPLSASQQHYLQLAHSGVARAEQRWSDPRRGWYDARLGDHERYPLATIWDIVPLFQSIDAIAIAQ